MWKNKLPICHTGGHPSVELAPKHRNVLQKHRGFNFEHEWPLGAALASVGDVFEPPLRATATYLQPVPMNLAEEVKRRRKVALP
jgi:hypothetical protein